MSRTVWRSSIALAFPCALAPADCSASQYVESNVRWVANGSAKKRSSALGICVSANSLTDWNELRSSPPATRNVGTRTFVRFAPVVTFMTPIAMPMTACTRRSGPNPQVVLPPAAASAVTVPREWPMTPARAGSTRFPNQPARASRMWLMSLTRSCMLRARSGRAHGEGRPSLQGMRSGELAGVNPLTKSIRTSSWVLLTWYGAATTKPAPAIRSSMCA